MKKKWFFWEEFAALMFLLVLLPSTAFTEESKRLIQTDPTTQTWMTENELANFIRSIREQGRFGGYMDVTNSPEKASVNSPNMSDFEDWSPKQPKLVETLVSELDPENIHDAVVKLSSFRNRYYQSESGLSAAIWIRDQFTTLSRRRNDVSVELFHHSFKQPSVIARIAANSKSEALLPQTIIIGGHEDSLTSSFGLPLPSEIAPGADDNASGIAVMLEVFRVIMDSGLTFDHSIEFIAYAGEERGLLGSRQIAQQYAREKRPVKAVLQLDMTMFASPDGKLGIVQDFVNPALTKFVEMLLDTYVHVPWSKVTCGYGCSDHATWDEAGYPAAFPFEASMKNSNPYIHSKDDTIDKIDAAVGLHFAKLASAFIAEAGMASRP